MEYIMCKIALIDIVIFKYPHAISIQHIIMIKPPLYNFQLKLILKPISLRIISSILRRSIYKFKP